MQVLVLSRSEGRCYHDTSLMICTAAASCRLSYYVNAGRYYRRQLLILIASLQIM